MIGAFSLIVRAAGWRGVSKNGPEGLTRRFRGGLAPRLPAAPHCAIVAPATRPPGRLFGEMQRCLPSTPP